MIEALLKITGYGWSYFSDNWNRFDFFVVIASILDLMLLFSNSEQSSGILSVGPQIAKLMRVLRVTRVTKLLKQAENLQAIIRTIVFSIPQLMNVVMLLMLFFFIFSLAGVFLFNEVKEGEIIDELKNFGTFSHGFLLLFAVTTGEDWNLVMYDCSR